MTSDYNDLLEACEAAGLETYNRGYKHATGIVRCLRDVGVVTTSDRAAAKDVLTAFEVDPESDDYSSTLADAVAAVAREKWRFYHNHPILLVSKLAAVDLNTAPRRGFVDSEIGRACQSTLYGENNAVASKVFDNVEITDFLTRNGRKRNASLRLGVLVDSLTDSQGDLRREITGLPVLLVRYVGNKYVVLVGNTPIPFPGYDDPKSLAAAVDCGPESIGAAARTRKWDYL